MYGQTGDPCDCYNFYQCDIDANSTVFGIKRRCPYCEMWSQADLTCVEDLSLPNCVNTVTTEGIGKPRSPLSPSYVYLRQHKTAKIVLLENNTSSVCKVNICTYVQLRSYDYDRTTMIVRLRAYDYERTTTFVKSDTDHE